jgi:hypothetical protein
MAKDLSGTLRRITLDGITFDCMADTNATEVGSAFENSAVPTSGRNMRKMMRRTENREGIVLACNGSERELLRGLADRRTDFPMSYETAAGDVYRAQGWIEFENRETEENRATIQMHPRTEWEPFIAS